MKKFLYWICIPFILCLGLLFVCGCTETFEINQSDKIDVGGAGNFEAINMMTNDTLRLSSAIGSSSSEVLQTRNGDVVKLRFIPAESYANNTFKTTFVLHNKEQVTDNKEYEYTIQNTNAGDYIVSLTAFILQSVNAKDESSMIAQSTLAMAACTFVMKVVE